jgi:hypothetical protein
MSTPPATSLQFEREEGDAPQVIDCSRCHQRILSVYYEVAGTLLCERCKFERESAAEGVGIGRFGRAFFAGLGAAIAGSLLYFAVSKLTGYEFGLIAIVVGVAVGKAVHWGSKGRGGWRYQTLAVGLTYLSIVGTYAPDIIQGALESSQTEEASTSASATSGTAASTSNAPESKPTVVAEVPPTTGEFALALVMLAGIIMASPFLVGFRNIIGLLIISFGLFEAWKINKKREDVVSGPFRLGDRSPAVPATPV